VKAVFADSFYYIAPISQDDVAHDRAVALSQVLSLPIITTTWVLTEVADALASPETRGLLKEFIERLRADPKTTILPATQDLFDRGLNLYFDRADKEWSLTDCISFVVMSDYGLADALTADRHFLQAGLVPLFQ
jgi:hypothetical protein